MSEQLYAVWVTDLDTGKGRWSGSPYGARETDRQETHINMDSAVRQKESWEKLISKGWGGNSAVEVRSYPQGYTETAEIKSTAANWYPPKMPADWLQQANKLRDAAEHLYLNDDAEEVAHNPDLALALFVTDPEVIADAEKSMEVSVRDTPFGHLLPQIKAGLKRAFESNRNGWASRAEDRADEIIAALEALSKE